jgi:hypothetical protein
MLKFSPSILSSEKNVLMPHAIDVRQICHEYADNEGKEDFNLDVQGYLE